MSNELYSDIQVASWREYRDDHLSPEERESLVSRYRAENPASELPEDINEAYVQITMP